MSSGQPPVPSDTHLPRRRPIDLTFRELSYSVPVGDRLSNSYRLKPILKSVSGQFQSGELHAIMGPSGAGKSSLMNVLAGFKTANLEGSVMVNGKLRNLKKFRKLACYIMQEDRLLPHLTVRESLMISADLRLDPKISVALKEGLVEEIIDTMGMREAANTRAMNLSGGQRKRLAIAQELIKNPPVMFFDEPTSGLDSLTCTQLIELLKILVRGGRTIICTIHQPSARIFEMFDNLMVLAKGQCIYHGAVDGLVGFLAAQGLTCPSFHNPADYVIEVASGEHGQWIDKLVTAVNEGKCDDYGLPKSFGTFGLLDESVVQVLPMRGVDEDESNEVVTEEFVTIDLPAPTDADQRPGRSRSTDENRRQRALSSSSRRSSLLESIETVSTEMASKSKYFQVSYARQSWILLKRTFVTIRRDQNLTHMRIVSHLLVGALIGMIYYDIGSDASKILSNAGCIFFTLLFTMFAAMMPTILTFPNEFGVFVREHLNCWYSLEAFFFAKTVADFPFQVIFTSVFTIAVYYLTSQPANLESGSKFLLISVLNSLVAQNFGLLIGAGMSVETGTFVGPVSTIPTILFCGFLVRYDVIPRYLRWLTYLSHLRYGFEGAILAVYGPRNPDTFNCFKQSHCHYPTPEEFLEEMSMADAEYWVDAIVLVALFVLLRLVAYFVLRWKLQSIR